MPQTPGTNQWIVSNALDFQTALTAVETNSTLNTIVITRDIATPASSAGFTLPKKIAHPSKKLFIKGNNSTISAKSGQTAPLLSRSFTAAAPPTAFTDLRDQILITDLNFNGAPAGSNATTCFNCNLKALVIEGASNVLVENCNFNVVGYGLFLSAVQTALVTDCIAQDIYVTAYTTSSVTSWNSPTNGLFSVPSTYSRNITFNKCTSILGANALYGFLIQKSANTVLNDCIASGPSGQNGVVHHVFYDAQGGIADDSANELINNFNIYNITINSPALNTDVCAGPSPVPNSGGGNVYLGSLIKLRPTGSMTASGSYVKIDGLHLHPNVGSSLVINSSTCSKGFADLYVYNVPYLNPSGQFVTDGGIILANTNCAIPPTGGTIWEFKETFDAVNIFASSRWLNGVIPFYRLADNFSFSSRSKNYLTNFMMINNKTVSQ